MTKKIDIGQNAKVKIQWNVHQSNYSKELENSIIALMAKKYGIPQKNIVVEPNYATNGDSGILSTETVQSIQDPKFQQELMKQFITNNDIKDIDFEEIIKIDSQINSLIDYDIYDKGKKYEIKWVKWDNFLSYGSDNYFDFTTLKGLVLLNGEPANKSGKSTFAKLLSERINANVCEVDIFFREAFIEQKDLMILKLGDNCINPNGTVNFGLLSLLPPEKDLEIRMLLSETMDKKILNEIQKAENENKSIIFDYLFLTDCSTLLKADLIIYINTPIEIRYERMLARGKNRFKFTMEQFVAMDNLTKSTLKDYTPDLIINNSQNNNLNEQIEKIIDYIRHKQ